MSTPIMEFGAYRIDLGTVPTNVVNVTAFGAKGDNATINTKAFAAAIQAAQNAGAGVIDLPAGTFIVDEDALSSCILLPSNVHLRGAGPELTVIKLKPGSLAGVIRNRNASDTNIVIENLTIDGNRSASPDPNWEFSHGVRFSNVAQGQVRNCVIKNMQGDGIYLGDSTASDVGSSQVNISGNRMFNIFRNGVSIINGKDMLISRNVFDTCEMTAIDLEPDAGVNAISNVAFEHNVVTGCRLGFSLNADASLAPIRRVAITGNTFDNFIASAKWGAAAEGIHLRTGSDVTIVGNTIKAATSAILAYTITGLVVSGNAITGGVSGVYLLAVQKATISGNSINNPVNITVQMNGCNLVEITGNALFGGTYHVITAESTANNDVSITGNIITGSTAHGIHATAGARWSVIGNTVRANGAYGINLEAALTGCVVALNNVSGHSTKDMRLVMPLAELTVFGNRGYVTENRGVATVAAATTSILVNHGLEQTPTLAHLSVTPTSSLGAAARFWISNPTATQFTVNVDLAPGGAGASFVWSARLSS